MSDEQKPNEEAIKETIARGLLSALGGMRIIILLATTFTLSGCGAASRTGALITVYTSHCIDGVVYYQFLSGATVAYSPDGKVKVCHD